MDPLDYLRVLRRRWWVWAAVLVAALGAAVLTLPDQGDVDRGPLATSYTATHTLLQAPDVQTPVSLELTRLFATTGEIPRMAAVALDRPADDGPILAAAVTVTVDAEVEALRIATTDTDADAAARRANAFGEAIKEFLRARGETDRTAEVDALQPRLQSLEQQILELERRLADAPIEAPLLEAQSAALTDQYESNFARLQALQSQAAASGPLVTLEEATPIPIIATGSPVPTSTTGRLVLAAGLGLLLGLALALVIERLDPRVRTREEVEQATGLDVVAEVPRLSREQRRGTAVVTSSVPRGGAAEAYRGLRAAMLLVPSQVIPHGDSPAPPIDLSTWRPPRVLLVTSAAPAEGKTSTAVNLAAALAESGRSVLVIDADFRKPMAGRYLDVPKAAGLAELLDGQSSLRVEQLVRPTRLSNVRLLTSGTTTRAPGAMLSGFGAVVAQARGLAEVVIIDAAPMLAANDATDIVPHVDSVVLVTQAGRTSAPQVQRAVELLARLTVPVLGVVLQAAADSAGVGSYEGYGPPERESDAGSADGAREGRSDSPEATEADSDVTRAPARLVVARTRTFPSRAEKGTR